jgi:LPXTG-site transpeptidase (sortase) family protein
VCTTAGVALLGFYVVARVDGFVGRTRALEAFEQAVAAAENESASLPTVVAQAGSSGVASALQALGAPDQTLWGKARIAAYSKGMSAGGAPPLGVLGIPKIGLRVPVFEGTDELSLNRGVGRIDGTAALGAIGNVGIAGHRDGFFRGLKDIEVGDVIEVQSVDGAVRYRVSELLIVAPEDVYVLDPTERATLTLVTCYPFYFVGDAPQRFIVKATGPPDASKGDVRL